MGTWWIKPTLGLACVDDALLDGIDCHEVPGNVDLVFWYGTKGELLYHEDDRPRIREPITDLTLYIPIIDRWMTAATTATPSLTLTQSKFIKNGEIDALFASKRQAPVSYLGYTWSGTDESASEMGDQLAATTGGSTDATNTAFANLTSSTNDALSSLTASVNTALANLTAGANAGFTSLATDINTITTNLATLINSTIDSTVGNVNTSAGSRFTALVAEINAHIVELNARVAEINSQLVSPANTVSGYLNSGLAAAINPSLSSAAAGSYSPIASPGVTGSTDVNTVGSVSSVGSPSGARTDTVVAGTATTPSASAPTATVPTVVSTPISGPSIVWVPLDGPPQTLTFTQFNTLLNMITSRRGALQLTRQSKKNAVAALGTISGVIAYSATAGW